MSDKLNTTINNMWENTCILFLDKNIEPSEYAINRAIQMKYNNFVKLIFNSKLCKYIINDIKIRKHKGKYTENGLCIDYYYSTRNVNCICFSCYLQSCGIV